MKLEHQKHIRFCQLNTVGKYSENRNDMGASPELLFWSAGSHTDIVFVFVFLTVTVNVKSLVSSELTDSCSSEAMVSWSRDHSGSGLFLNSTVPVVSSWLSTFLIVAKVKFWWVHLVALFWVILGGLKPTPLAPSLILQALNILCCVLLSLKYLFISVSYNWTLTNTPLT